MTSPASQDSGSDEPLPTTHPDAPAHDNHPDPITGEPDAHPVGVGVGALGGGAAGLAVGAFAGPVGMIVGAAIGAIAGGLAGKEVAESPEVSPTAEEGAPLDEFERTNTVPTDGETPLSPTLAEHTNPPGDAFFTGGSGSAGEPPLDEFDRPRAAADTVAADSSAAPEDRPLPTASSGLITPEPDSFFADSTAGESSILTEHPYPAAQAVSPGDKFASLSSEPVTSAQPLEAPAESTIDSEEAVRTSAYYRYIDRQTTGQSGSEVEDWIEAEKASRR